MKIEQKYLPIISLRRSGLKLGPVKFIVVHDTGNAGSTAKQNVDYYIRSANDMKASAHAFVDDLGVIECIPPDEKAYHVRRVIMKDNEMYGVDAIDNALGIELCYFPNDIMRSVKAYDNYVDYIKTLCTKFKLKPQEHVVGHYTVDPNRRTDPFNAFRTISKTWDAFIKDLSPKIDFSYKFTKNMRLWDKNQEVEILQFALAKENLLTLSDVILKGTFDRTTEKAVRAFQEKYKNDILVPLGLKTPTGVVASMTIKKLNELFNK